MQQAPLPFAITRGSKHTLVYANSAFCELTGVNGETFGAPIVKVFGAGTGAQLTPILDRAFRDGVELPDQTIDTSDESEPGWRCSIWPVIADSGQAEALGIEIRQASQSDGALDLQRQ